MTLAHRVEATIVRGALVLLRVLGAEAASNLGGFIARTIGPWLPVTRVADANLSAALPELSRSERKHIIRAVWDNLGRTVAELPHVASLRRDTPAGPGYSFENAEVLEALAKRGGPAILVSAHYGNWEVLAHACAACGIPLSGVFRAADNPLLNALIQELRQRAAGQGIAMFAKGAAGARAAMAHLLRGGFLGMLVDQKMNDGIEARLFGLPAMTAPAAAGFAIRFNCPIICGRIERVGPARFRVIVEDPLIPPNTGNRQADMKMLTQTINDVLEGWIRARPGAWLWLHRRWPEAAIRTRR